MNKKKQLKILFISRAYPPVVGGIENQNFELSQWLPKITPTDTIANTRGKKFLPFFLLKLFLILPFKTPKYNVILLGDGVLGIISWWIKIFHKKQKVACIVHGLDLTYKNDLYQRLWVRTFIPTCNRLIAVGNQTIIEGVKRGINKELFIFIPNGVHPEKFIDETIARDDIFKIIGEQYRGKKILLTSGRLAKRKGVAWFIRNVLSQFNEDVVYIVAGHGPDKQNIQNAIAETATQKRIIIMGYVSDNVRNVLFTGSDAFIQPNIKVPGDMEGFGISVIEAGVSGLPVLAARLEGLKDAIIDGKNGLLVDSGNAQMWKDTVSYVLSDDFDRKTFGKNARTYISQTLSWDRVSRMYLEILSKL